MGHFQQLFLLYPQLSQRDKHREKSKHLPLVLTRHYQIQNISKVIYSSYSPVAKKFAEFKTVFKEPPMVAYRRPKSLSSYLVKNRYTPKEQYNLKTMIKRCRKILTTITNQMSKGTCAIKGAKPTEKSVAYVVECTKHKLIYIGQTRDQINNRFNRHRSDIRCYPDCELSKHFNSNDCDFEKDLKISILQKVRTSEVKRQYKEDQWLICLDTSYPNGLNEHLSDFGCLYQLLLE